MIKAKMNSVLFLIIILDFLYCKQIGSNFISFTDDEEITTITSDNETEFMKAIEELNENGGTIYIDTPVISLKNNNIIRINGKLPGGIIGIRQENGEYPRFDFTKGDYQLLFSGFNIYGSNKFIEYIIVENTPDNGISILGDNNILDHVISRYNYGSGFGVYGNFNTLNYCYAYRNNDISEYFSIADGFQIFGEINNIFNYCFAWDNANSGFNYRRLMNSSELSYLHSGSWNNGNANVFTGKFDYDNGSPLDKNMWTVQEIMKSDPNFISNYYNKKYNVDNANSGFNYIRLFNSSELTYLHSGSWNNGNINVFTGRYDYDNGNPLDKNLWTIQEMMESDPSFVSNYYNKKYNIDEAKVGGRSVKEWISRIQPRLDGNGFTFGNVNSSQSIETKRNSLYCASFDNKEGGFVDNYNHKYNAYFTNCVSFNNIINYRLLFTFSRWSENWSWGSRDKDVLNKVTTQKPSNTNTVQRSIYTVRDQIIRAVYANMFPDNINFDSVITRLK